MAEDSDLEKSEAPTPHRLEKAREDGQIPRSRELTSVLMLSLIHICVSEVVELDRMSQRMLAQIAGGQALRI